MRTPLIPSPEMKSASTASAGAVSSAVNWRGQSGRYYALFHEHLENFVLKGHDLYVITQGTKAQWIGTAGDIIDDQTSRARFRTAVKNASAVLRLSASDDGVERMRTMWDLEGGHLAEALSLAN